MKTIDFSKTTEKVVINGKTVEVEMSTIDLIKTALNSPVQGGYTASDMLTRIKILDKVEAVEKTNMPSAELEDAEYAALGKIVVSAKWNIVSRTIAEFVTSFDKK